MPVPCEEIRPELEALLGAMTDGSLDAPGRARLAEILRAHPEARQFYVEYCQMHALLAAAHGELRAMEAPRRRAWGLVAAAAAAAVLIGVLLWKRPSVGTLEGVSIVREGRPVPAGALREGDRVVTGKGERGEIRAADGSRFTLLERSEAELHRGRVELKEGALRCAVAPQAAPLIFATPHAEATVLGTGFELSADGVRTRLSTTSGRVRLAQDGRAVEVAAGELGLADRDGLSLWTPVCDLRFDGLSALPPQFETWFCYSDVLLTPDRKVVLAPERIHFVPAGLVPQPKRPDRNGLVEVRYTEEVGDDVVLEADVAGGARWSLGFAVGGTSYDGYRVIFAALDGYPNGVAVDTILPFEHLTHARDPRPISYDRDHTLRVERRGSRMRVWVDRELRIDTEIRHPLPEGRRRGFSLSNYGAAPVVRALRAWRAPR